MARPLTTTATGVVAGALAECNDFGRTVRPPVQGWSERDASGWRERLRSYRPQLLAGGRRPAHRRDQ
ncbi:hypothetical protein ACFPM0_22800 [Pseudonocardia sulfidoxydans]|uniref:hypothetical protein n=1 Tax=Pseudonocardia sulfidoxydans TaxID=54011 RepID=UPI00361677BE